jgi:hypothetical protein
MKIPQMQAGCYIQLGVQDEERLSALLSSLTGESIGVRWKPIRASSGNIRRKDQAAPEEKIKSLHVECAMDRLQEVKDKLLKWYSSDSRKFPDGTKMRLVPTITSSHLWGIKQNSSLAWQGRQP